MPSPTARAPASRDPPDIDPARLRPIETALHAAADDPGHPPRILILHGSVRARWYSRGVGDGAEAETRWESVADALREKRPKPDAPMDSSRDDATIRLAGAPMIEAKDEGAVARCCMGPASPVRIASTRPVRLPAVAT